MAVPVALIGCFEPREQPAGSKRPPAPVSAEPTVAADSTTPDSPPPGRSDCPRFSVGEQVGTVDDKSITEASGLAASRQNSGVLWTHNDSGSDSCLFAMSSDGRKLGTYLLRQAKADDWEDIAVGPGPESGESYLYVGDIGGNKQRRKKVVVYRTLEPEVELEQKAKKRRLDDVDELRLDYPKGSSYDSETLMVDPSTSDLYVVTKEPTGRALVFVARAPHRRKKHNDLEQVATLRLPTATPGGLLVTGGDIAADGSAILIRTYSRAYVWPRNSAQSVAEALRAEPCRVPLQQEPQGEAIAFTATADGYFTVSEGKHPPIYRYARRP